MLWRLLLSAFHTLTHLVLTTPCKSYTVIMPILQMRQLRQTKLVTCSESCSLDPVFEARKFGYRICALSHSAAWTSPVMMKLPEFQVSISQTLEATAVLFDRTRLQL